MVQLYFTRFYITDQTGNFYWNEWIKCFWRKSTYLVLILVITPYSKTPHSRSYVVMYCFVSYFLIDTTRWEVLSFSFYILLCIQRRVTAFYLFSSYLLFDLTNRCPYLSFIHLSSPLLPLSNPTPPSLWRDSCEKI